MEQTYIRINSTTNIVENLEVWTEAPTQAGFIFILQTDGIEVGIGYTYDPVAGTFMAPAPPVGASEDEVTSVPVRNANLTLFVPASDIATGFGALPPSSGTASWTHTLQVNGEDAVRVDASGVPHANDADYIFTYTALNDWVIQNTPLASTSGGLTYDRSDLFIEVSNNNSVYAVDARIEVLKDLVASATDFDDLKGKIANL